jgi:hypothetical protein
MLFELITVDMKKEMMKRFTILRNELIAAHGFYNTRARHNMRVDQIIGIIFSFCRYFYK